MSATVLVVDEIASSREELGRALDADGFKVVQSDSASAAVRSIWENQFLVVFIASILSDTKAQVLSEQLQLMAPEIETIIYGKNDIPHRLARKAVAIENGEAAA